MTRPGCRYPLLAEPDPISDWASGVVWMLTRLEGIADGLAAGSAVPVDTQDPSQLICEHGQASGHPVYRNGWHMSTCPGPVATPTEPVKPRCEHGSTRAHRRRISQSEILDCPGPAAAPPELVIDMGFLSIGASAVIDPATPTEPDGTEQDGEPLTYEEVVACLADDRGEPDWVPPAEQDGQR